MTVVPGESPTAAFEGTCQTKSVCEGAPRESKSATIRGALAFIPRRFAPVFWIGFFTVIQSVFLIGLESAEGYPLPVNDIPQAREIPKNTPYHDVFMGTLPSSRRGNTSSFSVGCPRLDGRETNLLGLRNLTEVVRGLVLFESRSIIA
ncbi:hypothetical protein TNCV_2678041 [Trichonephila clavipes]|nr:hypothetical protein TNCV_2678041 [Trichonephila clavipes]